MPDQVTDERVKQDFLKSDTLLLVTSCTTNMFTVVGRSFFFAFALRSSKTDPYCIFLKFSTIFPIVQVGNVCHSGIILVTDSVCISPALCTVNACSEYTELAN